MGIEEKEVKIINAKNRKECELCTYCIKKWTEDYKGRIGIRKGVLYRTINIHPNGEEKNYFLYVYVYEIKTQFAARVEERDTGSEG